MKAPSGPLITQSDHTLLLEVEHPQYTECRDFLVSFAELVKSPEFIHTYRVSPLSLWNAAAVGIPMTEIHEDLQRFAKYPVPANVLADIQDWHAGYGKLVLRQASPGRLCLEVIEPRLWERLRHDNSLAPFWLGMTEAGFLIAEGERGSLKHALIKAGYPVKDECGYLPGESLEINLRAVDTHGQPFALRDYQADAVEHIACEDAQPAAAGAESDELPLQILDSLVGVVGPNGEQARIGVHHRKHREVGRWVGTITLNQRHPGWIAAEAVGQRAPRPLLCRNGLSPIPGFRASPLPAWQQVDLCRTYRRDSALAAWI